MPAINRFPMAAAIIVLLFTSLSVHAQKRFADAIEMNSYLITPNDSLYVKGKALGKALGAAYGSKDFSGIQPAKQAILRYASEKLAELKTVKDQFGSEEFRKGIMEFLEFEINVMKNKTPLLDRLNDKSTEAEIRTAIEEMMRASRDEEKLLARVSEMQARFAERNGFVIEQAEEK